MTDERGRWIDADEQIDNAKALIDYLDNSPPNEIRQEKRREEERHLADLTAKHARGELEPVWEEHRETEPDTVV